MSAGPSSAQSENSSSVKSAGERLVSKSQNQPSTTGTSYTIQMFSPMNLPPGVHPGFPPPMFSPFPPGHPGSPGHPPGMMVPLGMPPRQERPRITDVEEQTESQENKLLKQILLGLSKISKTVKSNDQALRDITNRQSSLEDRISLMEQRILRIDDGTVKLLDQNKNLDDNVKKVIFEVGKIHDEVKELKATVNDNTIDKVGGDAHDLIGEMGAVKEELQDIKRLVQESAANADKAEAALPPPEPVIVEEPADEATVEPEPESGPEPESEEGRDESKEEEGEEEEEGVIVVEESAE